TSLFLYTTRAPPRSTRFPYTTLFRSLWERKAIGWTQIRPGPNRVGPMGLLQPIADAVKLIFKEIIIPSAANKGLFLLAPVMTIKIGRATSELQSLRHLVCRLLLEKKK